MRLIFLELNESNLLSDVIFLAAKPAFTSRPRNATAHESSIVEFTCIAVGHPYPDITWWNSNRLVLSDGRITVSNGGIFRLKT